MEQSAVPPDNSPTIGPARSTFASTRRRERLPWPKDQPFRILSIDGGGIKGIYPAAVLASLEAELLGDRPVTDYFDMVVGTSTGGILALGLSAGHSARKLLQLYTEDGKEVFPPVGRVRRYWRDVVGTAAPRQDRAALGRMLDKALKGKKFAEAKTRLCIPAFEGHHGQVFIFKTPHHPDYRKDGYEKMTTVGLATAAAPTYYPALDSGGYRYIDGGVWANTPTMIGVVDALACFAVEPAQIRLLSIGCGREPFLVDDNKANGGLWAWRYAIYAAMDLQSQNAMGQAKLLLGPENLVRMEPKPGAAIALDDWARAHIELPPLAARDFEAEKDRIREMFCYGPVDPLRMYWPPAEIVADSAGARDD